MVTAAARPQPILPCDWFEGEIRQPDLSRKHLLDDANWTRIPVLTSASVVAQAHDMCTRPPEEARHRLDRRLIGQAGEILSRPKPQPDRIRVHYDTWSRAGLRAGDPR